MQNNKNHLLIVYLKLPSCTNDIHFIFSATHTCILVHHSHLNCDISTSEWITDADLTKYLVHSCVHKTEELYENSRTHIMCVFFCGWMRLLSFFINSLFEKSYWYHRLRNTQLHSFLSLQWFIVTRVLSEPQHIKPRSFEMTKPVCC